MVNPRALALAVGLLAPGSPIVAQQADAIPPEVCDSVRTLLKTKGDSLLALEPRRWKPDSSAPGQVEGARGADVTVLVRVDTLGKPDIGSFKPVRWRTFALIPLARTELQQMEPMPYDVFHGCRAAYVLTVPFRFRNLR